MLLVHEGKNLFNCSYCDDTFQKSKGLLSQLKEVHEGGSSLFGHKIHNFHHTLSGIQQKQF